MLASCMPDRFIICSDHRSGSYMVASALQSRMDLGIVAREPLYNERFSERQVSRLFKPGCGFITLRSHGLLPWKGKVILLRRENHLRRYASLLRARMTQQWWGIPSSGSVEIHSDDLESDVENYESRYQQALEYYNDVKEVVYEDVDFVEIQRFLGLDVQEIRASTLQQDDRKIQDILTLAPSVT